MESTLKIAMAQIAPVWLDKKGTIAKVEHAIIDAGYESDIKPWTKKLEEVS